VLAVAVRIPGQLPLLFRQIADAFPNLTYYDADISLPQRYGLARGLFPLAYCAAEHDSGRLRRIEASIPPGTSTTACRRCA